MGRRTERLSLDNLGDLPQVAQTCVFWQFDPVRRTRIRGQEAQHKRRWVAEVLEGWGSCGRIVYVDDEYAGHMIWAPPAMLPGSATFATAPASPDAVLVAGALVLPEHRHHGVGRLLVHRMARDILSRTGRHAPGGDAPIRAIEAFGAERPRSSDCVLPVDFWLSVGFTTHRPHLTHPRMRMDLRSLATWRGGVEQALERLTGGVQHPAGQHARS